MPFKRVYSLANSSTMLRFLREILSSRYLVLQLVKRDFKNRYIGSVFGLFWAFVQPLALMSILWFVFSFGLKAHSTVPGVPFVAWFFTAMIAWNYFADVAVVGTNVLNEYSFLLKKVEFRMSVLPLIKILSSLVVHLIFVAILAIVLMANGIYPSWYWLQFIYYTFALMVLMLGMGWLTSALNVFIKDTTQIMSIVVQFGFWMTPVLWDIGVLPEKWRPFVRLNPMTYITEGYRNSFLFKKPFWEAGFYSTMYFWCFSLVLFFFGIYVFRKLRPHFGDVI